MKLTSKKNLNDLKMQGNKQIQETQKPRAITLLESALGKLKEQLVSGDIKKIAKKAKKSKRTIERYINESLIADFETGQKILNIGNQIVADREQSLQSAA